ncbi:MAG: alpha/beta fold hydrolase, partial [Bradyrhizobium sp.]
MPNCWVEANGVQLRFERRVGPGGTIVLLHEMGGALESWDNVVPLLQRYATVLRYDQRGAGLSEKPREPLSVENAANDLAGLLDVLGISDPVAVVGAAVGAAVAVAFAAAYPERVHSLVLLAPATVLEGERRLAAEGRIEALEKLGIRKAFANNAGATRSRYEEIRLAADPASFAATWRMLIGLRMD